MQREPAEIILLVEDENTLRSIARQYLTEAGIHRA